ncbi:hypothetical protein [Winogradskyella sp.]|uniref:hypothetical protein n=1 Tax=Winogradskyella sp. TaxID=1883156 RepID=UPI003BAA2851
MLYLFWSLLNLGLIILFIYIAFGFIVKPKNILKSKFKMGFMLLCLIGLAQNAIAESTRHQNTEEIDTQTPMHQKDAKVIKTTLEKHLTFDINLHLTYSLDNDAYVLNNADSFLTGFVNGFEWDLKALDRPNSPLDYSAQGILKWKILGFTLYKQSKTYEGGFETLSLDD